jgi:uncharacterized protein (TIGR02231 family)
MKLHPLLYLLPSLLFVSSDIIAGSYPINETTIKEVRVFFQGAGIKREIKTTLIPGNNLLKITGISASAETASLNIEPLADSRLISAYFEKEDGTEQVQNELKKLRELYHRIQSEIQHTGLQIKALEDEKESLISNSRRIGTSGGMSLAEMDQTLSYVRKKQEEIIQLIVKKEVEKISLQTDLNNASAQIEKLEKVGEAASKALYISIKSEVKQEVAVAFSYYVSDCAWAPFYNIYSKGTEGQLDIEYKAHVLNNSGEDWNMVPVVLIPGNPANDLDVPLMESWVLGYSDRSRRGKSRTVRESGSEGEFSKKQMKDSKTSSSANLQLKEIEIEEGDFIFHIREKQTMASSTHACQVEINRFTKSASYFYKAVPKIESKAFLIAQMNDWEDIRMIEGEANVYMNNLYTGKTYVDPVSAGDTLEISLGPDPGIQITRVKKKDFSRRRLVGLQLTESFSYDIDIRNLNKKPVKIEIADQIPVAQESDINVSLDESTGGTLTETNGRITWNLELPPSNNTRLKLGYSVRYPRDKIVVIKRTSKLICPSHFY